MTEIEITMPDGTVWRVPASVIADDYAQFLVENGAGGTHEQEFKFAVEYDSELLDWAKNNMNWSDVVQHARHVRTERIIPDYDHGWPNSKMKVLRDARS